MSGAVEFRKEARLIGLEHIGMTCTNIDQTIAFYCDLLGLKLALRKTSPGGDVIFLDTDVHRTGVCELSLHEECADDQCNRHRELKNYEAIADPAPFETATHPALQRFRRFES